MEYPIILETEEERIECSAACDKIEDFLKREGENLKYNNFKTFMNIMNYSSKTVEAATYQEVYKELARVGLCLNINLEGSAKYDITFKMAEEMWIIMHVKYMTEFIRDKKQSALLDYVASWLKIICEQQSMNFGDFEKYI